MMNEPLRTCGNNALIPGHSKRDAPSAARFRHFTAVIRVVPSPCTDLIMYPIAPGTTQYLSHTVVITNQRTSSGLAFQIIGGCSHEPRAVISFGTV